MLAIPIRCSTKNANTQFTFFTFQIVMAMIFSDQWIKKTWVLVGLLKQCIILLFIVRIGAVGMDIEFIRRSGRVDGACVYLTGMISLLLLEKIPLCQQYCSWIKSNPCRSSG
jgi:hypothetical protein